MEKENIDKLRKDLQTQTEELQKLNEVTGKVYGLIAYVVTVSGFLLLVYWASL